MTAWMRRVLLLAAASLAGACAVDHRGADHFSVSAPETALLGAPDCGAFVRTPWASNAAGVYTAEASSIGGRCETATLYLALRDQRGQVIWSSSHVSGRLFGFDGARDRSSMSAALLDWITQLDGFSRAGDLPRWPIGASQPTGADGFPFLPAPGVRRSLYEGVRAADAPLFCYVQGLESVRCLALRPDQAGVIDLGVQTFPG